MPPSRPVAEHRDAAAGSNPTVLIRSNCGLLTGQFAHSREGLDASAQVVLFDKIVVDTRAEDESKPAPKAAPRGAVCQACGT